MKNENLWWLSVCPQFKQHLTQINSGSQSTLVWNSLEPFAGFHCVLCGSPARIVKFDEMEVVNIFCLYGKAFQTANNSIWDNVSNFCIIFLFPEVFFPKQGRRQGESILMLGEDFGCVCPDFALLLARIGFAFFSGLENPASWGVAFFWSTDLNSSPHNSLEPWPQIPFQGRKRHPKIKNRHFLKCYYL